MADTLGPIASALPEPQLAQLQALQRAKATTRAAAATREAFAFQQATMSKLVRAGLVDKRVVFRDTHERVAYWLTPAGLAHLVAPVAALSTPRPPQRVQLRRTAGWRKPEGCVVCTRPGPYGNPFVVNAPVDLRQINTLGWTIADKRVIARTVEQSVKMFAACLLLETSTHRHLRAELRGRDCACWCAPDALCHLVPLMTVANSSASGPALRAEVDAAIAASMAEATEKWGREYG